MVVVKIDELVKVLVKISGLDVDVEAKVKMYVVEGVVVVDGVEGAVVVVVVDVCNVVNNNDASKLAVDVRLSDFEKFVVVSFVEFPA